MAVKKKQATPSYNPSSFISPQAQQALQSYYAPGGGFAQSMAANMVPTGQGGYTAAQPPPYTGGGPIMSKPPSLPGGNLYGQPIIGQPPNFTGGSLYGGPAPSQFTGGTYGKPVFPSPGWPGGNTPPPNQAPQPPGAQMDWGGLMSKLQGILGPYLGGGGGVGGAAGGGGVGGNPMQGIMGALMNSMMGLMGQFNPGGTPGSPTTGGGGLIGGPTSAGAGLMGFGKPYNLMGGLPPQGNMSPYSTGGGSPGYPFGQKIG